MSWPLTLGHEIAGTIAELGDGVEDFAVGDRVAVGWFGGCCYHCDQCRKGQFHSLRERESPELAVSRRLRGVGDRAGQRAGPDSRRSSPTRKPPRWAAPASPPTTPCATRRRCPVTGSRSSASAGSATSGCSSPGRWASRPSRSTRGTGKADDARKLGAHHYIDSTASDPAEALKALGGATVVLATAGNSGAMAATVGGILAPG